MNRSFFPVTVRFGDSSESGNGDADDGAAAGPGLPILAGTVPVVSPGRLIVGPSSAASFQIVATNAPTSYGAAGLPAWLSVNTATGLITGTSPAALSQSTATISATNRYGTGSAKLTIIVANALTVTFTKDSSYANTQLGSMVVGLEGATPVPVVFGQPYVFFSQLYFKIAVNNGANLIPDVGINANFTYAGFNSGENLKAGSQFNYVVTTSLASGNAQPYGQFFLGNGSTQGQSVNYGNPTTYNSSYNGSLTSLLVDYLIGTGYGFFAMNMEGFGGLNVNNYYLDGTILI